MNDIKTKITEGGRIVIPAKLRKLLDFNIGDEIILRQLEDSILILNKRQATKMIQSIAKKYSGKLSLADALISERRIER